MVYKKKVKDISELAKAVAESSPTEIGVSSDVSSDVSPDVLPTGTDRANSVIDKEVAMYKAGVTRQKAYGVIRDLLEATIEERKFDDKNREWVTESRADVEKRTKGAELALKAFGDLKEMKSVEGAKTYNTVVYQWKK